MVRAKVAIGGHPVHPALIPIPIGMLTLTVVADAFWLFAGHSNDAITVSFWSTVIGVVSALIAALPGFIDFFSVARFTSAGKLAIFHMICNLSAVALYAVSAWLMYSQGLILNVLIIGLQVAGFAAMMVGGYIGGEMVYRHKLAVVETEASSRTSARQKTAA